MNLFSLLNSPFKLVLFVLGMFLFILIISLALAKILPLFTDSKYRRDQKSWFLRNWKWFVPVAIIVIVSFNISIIQLMKSSGIYKESIRMLHQSKEATRYLGSPINTGYFIQGEISSAGGHIGYSVSGPKGEGTLVAEATVQQKKLKMNYVYILLESGKKIILVSN